MLTPPSWEHRLQVNKFVLVVDAEKTDHLHDVCLLVQRAPHMSLNTLCITSTKTLAVELLTAHLPATKVHAQTDVVCIAPRLGELDATCHFDIVIMVDACEIPSKLTFAGYLRIEHIVQTAAHVVLVSEGVVNNESFYTGMDSPQFHANRVYEV
jgi:hypothetical protein